MKMITTVLLYLTLCFVFMSSGDCHALEWGKSYGGANPDSANSVQQTSDGGYIVAGVTYSFGTSNDAWVLKLDATGNVEWQKTYGGANWDSAKSIQQTSDGGFIVAGFTYSFSAGSHGAWVLKLDATGNVAWQKIYGGADYNSANFIQQTSDGGYIVAGQTSHVSGNLSDAWILKLDATGNVEWQKAYGGTGFDHANSVQQTSDGGYTVAGCTLSFGSGNYDAWVFKLDASGNVVWQKSYGGANWDYALSIQQTADSGYIVAGYTYSFGVGTINAWVLKLDAFGNATWQKTYGGPNLNYARSIQQTSDGGYIVTGFTTSFCRYGNAWIFKLDPSGNIAWQKIYEGAANSIHQTSDSGYVVAGYASESDVLVLKLNANGEIASGDMTSQPFTVTVSVTTVVGNNTAATEKAFSTPVSDTSATVADTFAAIVAATFNAQCSDIPQYVPQQYTLKVIKTGVGSGIVTSLPTGINCGTDCTESCNSGTSVTLTATPASGSTFEGWSGGGCSGTGICTVTINADTTITAVFAKQVTVQIDIKPGSDSNAIKLKDTGNIPVAIFGSSSFNVAAIDISTLKLNGASVEIKGNGYQASFGDINRDGILDLLVHFEQSGVRLTTADTIAELTGTIVDGTKFKGIDSVKVIE